MESYTTILGEGCFEYEDRKSVFISTAAPVKSEAQALEFLAYVKKKYPDAKHHVYAYVLRENSIMRFSDDREPQGTAGMPVLDAIRKRGCTDTAVAVIRYFGGTLLGTGGLVRAYSAAAVGAIEKAEIITYDIYSFMDIDVAYSDYQRIVSLLQCSGFKTNDIKYSDSVTVRGKIKSTDKDKFINDITDMTGGRVKIRLIDEKFDF